MTIRPQPWLREADAGSLRDVGNARRPTHADLFHVTTRSVAEERIFATDDDYVDGVHRLARLAADRSIRCHAFCLMPTHYHLLASFDHVFDSPYRPSSRAVTLVPGSA